MNKEITRTQLELDEVVREAKQRETQKHLDLLFYGNYFEMVNKDGERERIDPRDVYLQLST